MTLLKSLILGSAAGLVAVAGAQAADLPMAEPVEYVKICDTYGNGFFYLPGTETCLKVGGYVRVEAIYVEPRTNAQDKIDFHVRGTARFDARTATEYGLLRSYISIQLDRDGGGTGTSLEYAVIQFAGLTVGYTDSMFDYKPYFSYAGMLTSDIQTTMFAYTAQFGDGFSATISAEDARYRRNGGGSTPDGVAINSTGGAGMFMPDIVANIRVDQGWGSAQLSAAVHEVKGPGHVTDYGWAVQGGVTVNLPMIAEDDSAYVTGAYAEGALSYLISGGGVGRGNTYDYAAWVVATDDALRGPRDLTEGFNVNAGFQHNWSPNWSSSISASYADIDYGRPINGFNADWNLVTVAGQTIWTPVKGLNIGLEVVYSDFIDEPQGLRRGYNGNPGESENWAGRLRVQRNF